MAVSTPHFLRFWKMSTTIWTLRELLLWNKSREENIRKMSCSTLSYRFVAITISPLTRSSTGRQRAYPRASASLTSYPPSTMRTWKKTCWVSCVRGTQRINNRREGLYPQAIMQQESHSPQNWIYWCVWPTIICWWPPRRIMPCCLLRSCVSSHRGTTLSSIWKSSKQTFQSTIRNLPRWPRVPMKHSNNNQVQSWCPSLVFLISSPRRWTRVNFSAGSVSRLISKH